MAISSKLIHHILLCSSGWTGSRTVRYAYDGELLTEARLADDRARYTYDAFNRTVRVETFDGHVQVNRYDAEGLRYEMEENGNLVRFIFNPDREAVVEEDSTGLARLIRGTELIARSTDAARTYYHYASDEMGSTTHIVDEAGAVQNRYEYDAWGNLTVQEEAVPNRFKYTGQQFDPVTQQYYLRARFYNPVIARFTQEDTYRGDGLNLYAYCANNPVFYVDPSGNTPDCVKDAIERYKKGQPDADDIEILRALQSQEEFAKFKDNIESEILRQQGLVTGGHNRWKGTDGRFVPKPIYELYSNVPNANRIDYQKVFFEQYPDLKGRVVVHHSIEQQIITRYPGLFTIEEINECSMLRGIPKEVNNDIHLSKIRKAWDDFYGAVDAGKISLKKEEFLKKAAEIDSLYGGAFNPPQG